MEDISMRGAVVRISQDSMEAYLTLQPPEYKEEWNFPAEESAIEHCKDLVKGIRNVRTEMDVPPSRKAKLYITSEDCLLYTSPSPRD